MNLVEYELKRDELVMGSLLRHWDNFGHLRPVQGIAMLMSFIPEEINTQAVLRWDKNNRSGAGTSLGVPLLKGDQICSWLDLDPDEECNQLNELYNIKKDEYLFSIETSTTILAVSVQMHRRFLRYWQSDEYRHPEYPTLKYFIEWALSKRAPLAWLDLAIKMGIYIPEIDTENTFLQEEAIPHIFDKSSTFYPQELDVALQAWKALSTTDGKGKPKDRIRTWLDENAKVSKEAKERIAIVANWDKRGGATRTD